ncbi:hypothetical protein ACTJJ0_30735 [Chitinophaga sp. 22321]|uniref:PIN domain-containing protein n=1 Tax=Chitinophaga hostae TaxID=2831022 RepID=A0ABS5J860_9BACT|nr:hypothetical protein [Chitinophaga hostae]MBS0031243.1 hypothetical protein [Chitinophaga hostae]
MNKQIVTYSLLAHIYNTGVISNNFEDIFVPIVKRGLARMCASGKFRGEDLSEIKEFVSGDTGLDMPDPILRKILEKIEKEVNTSEKTKAKFHLDGSFLIREYVFDDYNEEQAKKESEILSLEEIYQDFLKEEGIDKPSSSIYTFIEEGKYSLGKYINKKYQVEATDNTVEARFVNFLRSVPGLYRVLQSVYIGSILSTYLEYEPKTLTKGVELVLDTNFIISLLDLNTSGSTINCKKLLELGSRLGYKYTVLEITLREIDQLLKVKVDMFDSTFFSRLVDPEDIYNACHRRNLTKIDLERIRQEVPNLLEKENIILIPNVDKYENTAKFSDDYEKLKEVRHTSFAALHDATCLAYVKDKRKKNIHEFSKVNCWFVNNSSRRRSLNFSNGHLPLMIKAEDLLNMLWLSSPIIKGALGVSEMANIGLFRLVSSTLNDALPHGAVIKELEDNIRKYAKEKIKDEDIVYISRSIAIRSFTELEELNSIAEEDEKEFVDKLQGIVELQKQKEANQQQLIDTLVASFKFRTEDLERERKTIDADRAKLNETIEANSELSGAVTRLKREKIIIQNKHIQEKRDKYLRRRVLWWRIRQWIYFALAICIPILIYFIIWLTNPNDPKIMDVILNYVKSNWPLTIVTTALYLLLPGFIIAGLAQKHFNESGIAKYEERTRYPKELELLKVEDD